MEDIKVVKAALRRLQFKKKDILVLKNPDRMDLKLAMNDIMSFIIRSHKQ